LIKELCLDQSFDHSHECFHQITMQTQCKYSKSFVVQCNSIIISLASVIS